MLYLQYDVQNAVAVVNPIEKMLVFADAPATSAVDGGKIYAAVSLLFQGIQSVLQRYTFVLFTSPRPTVFLTWLIIPGIIYAWYRGERQVATQAALLLLVAIGMDSLGVRRNLKSEYFILTDPLIILAGALLLDRMDDLRWEQMGLLHRRGADRRPCRDQPGRTGQARHEAQRPRIYLRVE